MNRMSNSECIRREFLQVFMSQGNRKPCRSSVLLNAVFELSMDQFPHKFPHRSCWEAEVMTECSCSTWSSHLVSWSKPINDGDVKLFFHLKLGFCSVVSPHQLTRETERIFFKELHQSRKGSLVEVHTASPYVLQVHIYMLVCL